MPYNYQITIIPQQFTVKAKQPILGGDGRALNLFYHDDDLSRDAKFVFNWALNKKVMGKKRFLFHEVISIMKFSFYINALFH